MTMKVVSSRSSERASLKSRQCLSGRRLLRVSSRSAERASLKERRGLRQAILCRVSSRSTERASLKGDGHGRRAQDHRISSRSLERASLKEGYGAGKVLTTYWFNYAHPSGLACPGSPLGQAIMVSGLFPTPHNGRAARRPCPCRSSIFLGCPALSPRPGSLPRRLRAA